MVAQNDTGQVVRSLVRVPGSGFDITLPSNCLDLGKMSSIAASIRISPLPSCLVQPQREHKAKRAEMETEYSCTLKECQLDKHQKTDFYAKTEKRQIEEGQTAPQKKQRCDTKKEQSPDINDSRPIVICGHMQLLVHSGHIIQIKSPASGNSTSMGILGVDGTTPSMSQLHQELSSLRAENASLKRKLSLFQQLFKNKNRLTSVVKRLGVKVLSPS